MKQGMTLEDLGNLLDHQHEHKRDFIVDTKQIKLSPPTLEDDGLEWSMIFKDTSRRKARTFMLPMSRYMLVQVANHTGVPISFIDKMAKGTEKERAEIAKVITVRLHENPAGRMVRTLVREKDGVQYARAFLSDRYRVLDNHALLQAVFPVIKSFKGDLKIESCGVTEERMYIKFRYPVTSGSLGKVKKDDAQVDDIVQAGVTISNSEVGAGPVRVQPFLLRLVCQNGATVTMMKKGQRKIHIGKQLAPEDILAGRQSMSDDEFFKTVARMVKQTLKDRKFYRKVIKRFRDTKTEIMRDAPAAIRVLAKMFKLSEKETELVKLYLGTKVTRFELINAVTRTARHSSVTYDRATELEELGGKLIELEPREWKIIGNAKTPKELSL